MLSRAVAMAAEFGDLFEHEITNTLNHRKEKATILDKEIRDIIERKNPQIQS